MILHKIANMFSFIKNMPIKSRMLVFNVFIIIVPLFILAFYANRVSTQAIITKAKDNSMRELSLIDLNINMLVSNVEDYARILATAEKLQNALKMNYDVYKDDLKRVDINLLLSEGTGNVLKPNTKVSDCSIAAQNGDFFDFNNIDYEKLSQVFDKSMIEYVKKKQTPVWTDLFKLYDVSGRKPNDVLAVAKSVIYKNTGDTIGVCILYINEKELASIYQDPVIDNQNGSFYILDQNGNIISARDKNDLYKNFKHYEVWNYADLTGNGNRVIKIGGKEILITVRNIEKLKWQIVSIIPLEHLTKENRQINNIIIAIGLLCLIFAVTLSYLLSNSISKPILNLVKVMGKIKSGNLDIRLEINSKNEVGVLEEGFNNMMDRISNLMKEIYSQQKAKREYEFRLLQAQINPHFLYNTIETIISFADLDMKDECIQTAGNLASFYRISLSKGRDIISIGEEFQLIRCYLDIQKYRYIEQMDFSLDFNKDIIDCEIPKLTIQPLAENAIYHGLKVKGQKGHLQITGYCRDKFIFIEILDNGNGMTRARIDEVLKHREKRYTRNDFGISSVDARIRLLYGNDYGISIESELGIFTKVIIKLPLIRMRKLEE